MGILCKCIELIATVAARSTNFHATVSLMKAQSFDRGPEIWCKALASFPDSVERRVLAATICTHVCKYPMNDKQHHLLRVYDRKRAYHD
jgi:hypothetical protein